MSENKIRASVKNNELTLWVYDDIGPSWAGMVSAEEIAPALEAFNGHTVNVRINSPGGDIDQGLAIFNALDRHPAYKHVSVDGLAASMASVIAMVGDKISIASNGFLMIHDPWTTVSNNARGLRKTADILDKFGSSLAKTYSARTGKGLATIQSLMANETWYSGAEAVANGFCDELSQSASANASLPRVASGRYRNTPKSLVDNTKQFYRQAEIDRLLIEFGTTEQLGEALDRQRARCEAVRA